MALARDYVDRLRFTPTCVGKSRLPPAIRQRRRFTPTCVGKSTLPAPNRGCSDTVHPHVCGEIALDRVRPSVSGSPPRVWGNRRLAAASAALRRFTPTCVGKSPVESSTSLAIGSPPRVWGNRPAMAERQRSVHPHVCGEIAQVSWQRGGSLRFTPTCVGKSADDTTLRSQPRFTPTCVGKSTRGVAISARRFTPTCVGKSLPDARPVAAVRFTPTCVGKSATARRIRGEPLRFTPTCVGKSAPPCDASPAIGSPPRVWGNRARQPCVRHRYGSPPRVWGNRRRRPHGKPLPRFTPTCVGKSRRHGVKPRLRGSPPRVWGNLRRQPTDRSCRRFTPTCVGKSIADQPPALAIGSPPRVWGNRWHMTLERRDPVHPHVCGEIALHELAASTAAPVHPHVCGEICSADVDRSDGSPPRVWGNRRRCGMLAPALGSPPRVWGNHAVA